MLTHGTGLELCFHSVIVGRKLLINVGFHYILLQGRDTSVKVIHHSTVEVKE